MGRSRQRVPSEPARSGDVVSQPPSDASDRPFKLSSMRGRSLFYTAIHASTSPSGRAMTATRSAAGPLLPDTSITLTPCALTTRPT
jgi:hypothetical protein